MSSSRLGKGFEALFSADPAPSVKQGEAILIPLARIEPNPDQPRKEFDGQALEELAESIREKGIIQPIIVERKDSGGFVIVAGERRYRAAKLAGLEEIPALIKNYGDEERLEIALIENIQRTDLKPIEEALAYQKLIEMKGYTQEQLAKKLGKQRSTVANALRLLKLPDEIKELIEEQKLTPGHARAILSLEDENEQINFAREILRNQLNVRDAERMAERKRHESRKRTESESERRNEKDANLAAIETELMETFGTKVTIVHQKTGGTIVFHFYGDDDLDRLLHLLKGRDRASVVGREDRY